MKKPIKMICALVGNGCDGKYCEHGREHKKTWWCKVDLCCEAKGARCSEIRNNTVGKKKKKAMRSFVRASADGGTGHKFIINYMRTLIEMIKNGKIKPKASLDATYHDIKAGNPNELIKSTRHNVLRIEWCD